MSDTATTTFEPILVVATAETDGGHTHAIWQVETDPEVQRGDFSGAWLVTPEGIQGFAGDAEWIKDRHDPQAMLQALLRYPVLLTDPDGVGRRIVEGAVAKEKIIDQPATEKAATQAIEDAKETYAAEFPGKRQPAWGSIGPIAPVDAPAPEGHGENAAAVIAEAMATAKGLRAWIRDFNAFDKLRVRRLGQVTQLHSELTGVPLRFSS
ncbi:MAG TPA: N-acetylglucosamine-6-phosphate deacetylase [Candidatus Corynebacterium gallistercoris]|uniref:N-acetylglucosamine-6-phosphate deacetylase n=1 Tax=Candidatus Corynebacterium gallistercoris TaxID=2838530 RepID=A0A9D1RZA0_9CORY|nr:N-acetylglucosamine-6-phosphate deacetylase [Candidatus Corynebacterium gallistercoris]